MADKKRNITGSYPGAGGASQPKKNRTPAGSYPGKKPLAEMPEFSVPNQKQEPAPASKKEEAKQEKGGMTFAQLFSGEQMKKFGRTLAYYGGILVVSILLATWICHIGNEVLGLVRPDKEITVQIEEKSSTMEIAKALKEAEIIDHPIVFRLYCKLKKADGEFKFGEYTLNCKNDYNQLIRALKRNVKDKTKVEFTIRPGYTQEDLVTTLCDSLEYFEREELEDVLQNYDFSEFIFIKNLPARNYRLEGYLYPATYEMYEGESAVAVVRRILAKFEEMVLTDENKKKISDTDYTLDELITLASILQKEGGDQLPKAAGVYFNRLNNKEFPYLESQATVAYILPEGHGAVTSADIRATDPYNTYRNKGLAPGPITNPGADAIAAVLNPEKTTDLYFVAKSNGETLFAATQADHLKNIKKAGENPRGTGTVS